MSGPVSLNNESTFDFNFVNSILEIPEKIIAWLREVYNIMLLALNSLKDLLNYLMDIDDIVLSMSADCGESQFGLPIVQAIGTFRYMVGDVVFYTFYIIIVLGCLLTIYVIMSKLIQAIYSLIRMMKNFTFASYIK